MANWRIGTSPDSATPGNRRGTCDFSTIESAFTVKNDCAFRIASCCDIELSINGVPPGPLMELALITLMW